MPFKCSKCGFGLDKDSGAPYECPNCHECGTFRRVPSEQIEKKAE